MDVLQASYYVALHPYYKLAYIKLAWGGPDEQEAERKAGNPDTKDWQDEARKVLETTVEEYWKNRPMTPSTTSMPSTLPPESTPESTLSPEPVSEFDRHRATLSAENDEEEGWAAGCDAT
ncbi:hypothetical protein BD779DRAFT_1472420 [Infundibulicybe gibba]|nr:hypothetical protein BD779DRAFT_1472420 [Infundibulicybe gibba]